MRRRALLLLTLTFACDPPPADPRTDGGSDAPDALPDAGQPADAGVADAGVPDAGLAPRGCAPDALGPFAPGATLPEGRESHALARLGDDLLLFGGWSGAGATDTVFRAAPGAPWTLDPLRLPAPREHHGLVVTDAAICLIGGDDGREVSDAVLCAPRRDAEVQADWQPAPALPGPRTGHETVVVDGEVLVIGGVDAVGASTSQRTVYRATLGPDGRPGAWHPESELPVGLTFAAVAADGRSIYLAGGYDGQRASLGILLAELAPDGGLSPWREVGRLSTFRLGATATIFGAHLWVIGGIGPGGAGVDTVLTWPLDPDTGLGPPGAAAPLPAPRFGHATWVEDDALVLIGGWEARTAAPTATVWRARCE
jgi:hypothetical protein